VTSPITVREAWYGKNKVHTIKSQLQTWKKKRCISQKLLQEF